MASDREDLRDQFDRWVDRLPSHSRFAGPIVDVLDTAEGVRRWFADREELKATAADVVAMTALVMARAREQPHGTPGYNGEDAADLDDDSGPSPF